MDKLTVVNPLTTNYNYTAKGVTKQKIEFLFSRKS